MRQFDFLDGLGRDIRYAARLLAARPAFTLVALASLALGIGANTAIFSLIDAVLLRSLPIRNPSELVLLSDPDSSGVAIGLNTGVRGLFTYEEFEHLRNESTVLAGAFSSQSDASRMNASVEGAPEEQVRARLVSGDYFRVLGVDALLGRTFTAAEEKGPGSAPYIVLSYRYWQNKLGRNPGVLGRIVRVGKSQYTIIGVMPPEFLGETVGAAPDFWIPMVMQPQVMPGRFWLRDDPAKVERVMWLHIMGRLTPGTTVARAEANLNAVFQNVVKAQAGANPDPELRKQLADQKIKVRAGAKGVSELREGFTEPLLVLMGVVGLVLLIACANVANLLLARAASRRKEIGVRIALGASRARLIRQVLSESVLLSLLGGALGVLLAYWATRVLVNLVSGGGDIDLDTSPNLRVLFFTAGVSVLVGVLFGLAPALRVSGFGVNDALKEGSRSVTGSTRRFGAGQALVVAQVAISLILLIAAGLFTRTLSNLKDVNLGYRRDKLLIFRVDAQEAGYKGPQAAALYRRLLDRFRALPGVRAATLSENGLFSGTESGDEISVEGYKPQKRGDDSARFDQVGPGYFSSVGIPILMGREIGPQDAEGALKVCVINESMARFYFGKQNPIGRHITDEFPDSRTTFEIVGVSRDARDHRLTGEIHRRFYVPLFQAFAGVPPNAYFELRTHGDPQALTETIRRLVAEVGATVPVDRIRTLDRLLDGSVKNERIIAQLSAFFGALALLLACVGLYGVLSYAVARRTSEIGIRMALGAAPGRIVRMTLAETGLLVAGGALIGIPAAIAASRLVSSRLYGVGVADPVILSGATAALAVVAMLAAAVPALRAAGVDPVGALRSE